MGLTTCGECGGLLYETADTCLHCGATTRSKTSAITWVGVLAWVVTASIGLLVLSAYVSGLEKSPRQPSAAATAGASHLTKSRRQLSVVTKAKASPTTVSPAPSSRPPLIAAPPRETLKATIEEAQRLLADLGYPVGRADGIVGPKTRAAVKAFQRKEGLVEDGEVSDQLLSQLRRARERR